MTPIPEICNTFTALETVLISILIALLAGWGTFLGMGKRFMTRAECVLNHEKADKQADQDRADQGREDQQLKENVDKVLLSQKLQFMMLREIIVYMDLPADIKTKILNMKVS